MQHSSSSHQRKHRAAAITVPAAPTEAAADAATTGTLELPPSANDAAQACQAAHPADGTAAAAASARTGSQEEEDQQDLEQQQQQRESSPPGDGSAPGSRQSTPACQLPSMSVSQALCPVTRNFLGCLQHTYTCRCGHTNMCAGPASMDSSASGSCMLLILVLYMHFDSSAESAPCDHCCFS